MIIRPRIRPGELSAAVVDAADDRETLDAHNAAGEADQDGGGDGAPCPVRDIPDGQDGDVAEGVRGDPGSNTTNRSDLTEASTDMTVSQPNKYLGVCKVALRQRPSKPPSRTFNPRFVVRNRPDRLAPGPKEWVIA